MFEKVVVIELKRFLRRAEKAIKDRVPEVTGATQRSLERKFKKDSGGYIGTVLGAYYIEALDKGRGKAKEGDGVLYREILKWLRAGGGGGQFKANRNTAKAMAWLINEYGSRVKQGERAGWGISNVDLDGYIQDMEDNIAEGFISDITSQFLKSSKIVKII